MKRKVALFQHHPECSVQCCDGIIEALSSEYDIRIFSEEQCSTDALQGIDVIAFPGGIGDSDSYYKFFHRRTANVVADFIDKGGKYLGICMGAYWAGKYYFDILDDVKCVQYIKQPNADIRRSYSTVADVTWYGKQHDMFFYDGTAFVGDESKFETIARYANGDPMAIIQNGVGLIGCHPESTKLFYEPNYIKKYWHEGQHHKMLLNFVNRLCD